ncbi:insulinase family protein [Desulforhopalus sp. IMCC35007]|uniref:insulinase family protein n=1 Tax=Desulforhopalus sp. IMCC35007 TaxID=2569543 RepID=UPI0010AE912E|nr:insulinase family protein [Desulforhopalus sp. IMCC35007]TKB08451.1 peptidase M16 [Desulforhopalus sp. IMCC35007]
MTFSQGSTYSGFTLKNHRYIQEIDSDVYLFEHQLLHCPLLAIKNSDSNKTFSAAFNTIPTDSTGVAHILEHSVLMGSKKYPIKDVFGEINKGGLTTFLNAMTGGDITYYPFATRNLKEYFNIMDVYCDVVFNPLLERATFEQEGWHYHQESEDLPLEYQGVVYNEMKGAFSDPIRYIFHHVYAGLMPGSTYAHESGGDPQNIPDLSYEDFCAFHQNHYHPSNGMFFVYGDAPLEEELEFLQSKFFSSYDKSVPKATIVEGSQPTEPVFITESYAVDSSDLKEKTFLAVGTNISTVAEREENTAFQIIANILFNSDASPLKNAIVSSGLCKDFGGIYLSTSSYRTVMLTYLVGSEAEHRDRFLELYNDSLKEMVNNGLDHELVLSELNKFEFSFREESSKAQRGLDLIGKAMTGLKYETDPLQFLTSEELIASLRHKALHEGYFEELIKKYLLDNPSKVTVTLTPDPQKQKMNLDKEQEKLNQADLAASPEERQARIDRTRELMKQQLQPNSIETLSLLPQLSLDDLTSDLAFHAVEPTEMFNQQVLVSELPTNHISYIDIGFDISHLPPENLPLLDLFGTIITEIGTKRLNYQQFAKEVATCTGSLSYSLTSYTRKDNGNTTQPVFWVHLKCLPDYLERALALVSEIFSSVSFANRGRIREIVGREFAWAEHSVQSEGYSLPAARVFAHLSDAGTYNELFSGVTAYQALKDLALNYQKKEDAFLASLEQTATLLFNKKNLILANTADAKEIEQFSKVGHCIVDSLGNQNLKRNGVPTLDIKRHEAFITAAEVVFAVQGGNLFKNGAGYNGHFEVLKTYLSRDYLWNTVRQMGGAYGCFIQFGQISGNLAFISYRDPQVKKTYDAYNAVPEVVAKLDLPTKVMEQLIIGTYGNFDPLQSTAAKGATARNDYLNGITPAFKAQRVQEIIATSPADLRSFADNFAQMTPLSNKAIIGNRKKIEKDAELFEAFIEL